jgi:flagellar FliL protein
MPEDDEKTTVQAGDTEVSDSAPESGGGKKKLLLFGGMGLGAVVIAVVLALFVIQPMMSGDGGSTDESHEVAEADDHAEEESHDDGGGSHGGDSHSSGSKGSSLVYAVQDIVVNPAGTGGSRFLSASFAVEVQASGLKDEMEKKDAMVRDALITILSSKTVPQLTDPKQKEIVRYQIKKRLQQLLGTEAISNVYFTDFVLQ